MRPHATGVAAVAARAFLLFTLALPCVDALYRSSTGLPLVATTAAPTFSYRAARANPTAFATWWFYYLNESIRADGMRTAIDAPDPQKKLPFVQVPGSSGRMFEHHAVHINNLGFRRTDMIHKKGNIAPRRGARRNADLRAHLTRWRKALARAVTGPVRPACLVRPQNRGHQRRNRGLYARQQSRAYAPRHPAAQTGSHPQHAWNERLFPVWPQARSGAERAWCQARASALIGRAVLTIERAAHDWRERNSARATAVALAPMSDAELMRTRYADEYRKLIALARDNGADIALADATMSVNDSSPREVKDFYGAVFKPIDDIIAANAAHNRMVNLIAREEGAPLIDMAAGVDGVGTTTSISTSSTSPKRATNESPTSCSGRCCRSWRSGTTCIARFANLTCGGDAAPMKALARYLCLITAGA